MSVLKIGIASVASVGGVAGTIVLVKHFSSEKKIKSVADELRDEHFTPITDESDWNTMLTKYNEKKEEVGGRFTSENIEIKLEDLKASCKLALSENISKSKQYSKSRRWCTIPKTLSSLLNSHKLTLLNTDANTEGSKDNWVKLQKSYETKTNNRISGLDLGTEADNKWKKLKEKCKEISEKTSVEADFETLFDNLKTWCIKEESDKLPT